MNKPMLAANVKEIDALKFPLLCTPKLDGIRCLIQDGVAVSRTLKPIRNKHIQGILGNPAFEGLDGELMLRSAPYAEPLTDPDGRYDLGEEQTINGIPFHQVTSAVMSTEGEPDFVYIVFDRIGPDSYQERMDALEMRSWAYDFIKILMPSWCRDKTQFMQMTQDFLKEGYEGIIMRDPQGRYKHGRSTVREQGLLKWKPVMDAEATVIGFYEEMHNTNKGVRNALGRTERSTAKEGLTGKGRLGGLIVQDIKTGTEFRIGSGYDAAQRLVYWRHGEGLIGLIVKYKCQEEGSKDKPRFPVFLGFRDKEDM